MTVGRAVRASGAAVKRHDGQPRGAFERAVQREFEAIDLHISAALQLEEMAAQLERHALRDPDDLLRRDALTVAAHARERAQAARVRAASARERLRAEGVVPPE